MRNLFCTVSRPSANNLSCRVTLLQLTLPMLPILRTKLRSKIRTPQIVTFPICNPIGVNHRRTIENTLRFCDSKGLYVRNRQMHNFNCCMMTSSNGNIFRFTGPLWVESTGHGSDADLCNLRGKTSAVGDFLEAIRHIRQNCVLTNFRLQVLDSSRPFYSDNEIPKIDVYISTNTRVFIYWNWGTIFVGEDQLLFTLLATRN